MSLSDTFEIFTFTCKRVYQKQPSSLLVSPLSGMGATVVRHGSSRPSRRSFVQYHLCHGRRKAFAAKASVTPIRNASRTLFIKVTTIIRRRQSCRRYCAVKLICRRVNAESVTNYGLFACYLPHYRSREAAADDATLFKCRRTIIWPVLQHTISLKSQNC